MRKFTLDGRYADLIRANDMDVGELLRRANLPGDALAHRHPTLDEAQYFRLMEAIGETAPAPDAAVRMATVEHVESFSPPIFASYCSRDGRTCIDRLARYKRLVGPLEFDVVDDGESTTVRLCTQDAGDALPQFLVMGEIAFLTGIIRKATQADVVPARVEMREPPADPAFSEFCGVTVKKGEANSVTFSNADLDLPFVSHDEAMWSYFEPELSRRLEELDVDDSTSARVRSALAELLPAGACGIGDVADKLGMSARTLQRRLSDEGTTFQKQLSSTRETLAKHYLANTDMTAQEVAYLLGYAEFNSFTRAFSVWTGKGVAEWRKDAKG